MKRIVFYFILFIPILMHAQPTPPNSPAPIDGGLGILLAAGLAYGVKKVREQNNL
ncbi:MAG: hypothetical protein JJU02_09765 [Cryomorphaceae bacterium]|nr:hypothetical protein [Cryomorphaceae bacterium]